MRVTVLPWRRATFLRMYLYHMSLSAMLTSESKRMSISAWPAVATSWCFFSTPGVIGLVIDAIFAASLGAIGSEIISCTSVVIVDFYHHLFRGGRAAATA